MIRIRSILFNVAFYVAFVALMIGGIPFLASRSMTMRVVRLWARVSLWLLEAICGTRVEFRDLALRPRGAAIVAIKHQSFLETIALITVLDDFSYILKKELLAIPGFGWYLRASGQIAIDRAKRAGTLAALQVAVREKLDEGCQILIFPEGTRQPIGAPPAYKVGVAALVAASGIGCTPVALNTGLFWPRRTMQRRPGTVVIQFLPPIPAGLGKRAFMKAVEGAIEPAANALVAEAMAADPSLAERVREDQAREEQARAARTAAAPATARETPPVADPPRGARRA